MASFQRAQDSEGLSGGGETLTSLLPDFPGFEPNIMAKIRERLENLHITESQYRLFVRKPKMGKKSIISLGFISREDAIFQGKIFSRIHPEFVFKLTESKSSEDVYYRLTIISAIPENFVAVGDDQPFDISRTVFCQGTTWTCANTL